MKFSIIIPVYNSEKYIDRCLNSVLTQTYNNYEIIIINDGSTDNSEKILKKYESNKKIKIISQTNHGVSSSRNIGIKESTGDYILFLDSDDFYENDILETLKNNIKDEDIIKFGYKDLKENKNTEAKTIIFKNYIGKFALKHIIEAKILFDTPWMYAFKTEYMKKHEFTVGKYHEDFGLIPLMVFNSKKVTSINYYGYIYNRDNETSITSFTNMEKEYKKACDTLYFFKQVKNKYDDRYLLSFYSTGCINRIKNLKGKYKKDYLKELKKEKIYNYILDNNIKRKIKKLLLKIYFIFK